MKTNTDKPVVETPPKEQERQLVICPRCNGSGQLFNDGSKKWEDCKMCSGVGCGTR